MALLARIFHPTPLYGLKKRAERRDARGVSYELGGLYAQQQIAFHGLMQVFVAAAALVFLLLLFMYESFTMAISIVLTAATAAAVPAVARRDVRQ